MHRNKIFSHFYQTIHTNTMVSNKEIMNNRSHMNMGILCGKQIHLLVLNKECYMIFITPDRWSTKFWKFIDNRNNRWSEPNEYNRNNLVKKLESGKEYGSFRNSKNDHLEVIYEKVTDNCSKWIIQKLLNLSYSNSSV